MLNKCDMIPCAWQQDTDIEQGKYNALNTEPPREPCGILHHTSYKYSMICLTLLKWKHLCIRELERVLADSKSLSHCYSVKVYTPKHIETLKIKLNFNTSDVLPLCVYISFGHKLVVFVLLKNALNHLSRLERFVLSISQVKIHFYKSTKEKY